MGRVIESCEMRFGKEQKEVVNSNILIFFIQNLPIMTKNVLRESPQSSYRESTS